MVQSKLALFAALLVLSAITSGLSFGNVANHGSYLIEGLRLARPGFLDNDWFASETYHYHPAFAYVVYLSSR
jgi:hypothetical protein